MTTQQLIAHFLERGNALQTFWGFYIAISGAIVTAVGKGVPKGPPFFSTVLSVAFCAFAFVNCSGMLDIIKQRHFFFRELEKIAADRSPSIAESEARLAADFTALRTLSTPKQVLWFHLIADVLVLTAVWILTPRS